MANKHKGDAAFGPNHTLRLDWNALCEAEDQLGCSIIELFQNPLAVGAKTIRTILCAGLQAHHPGMTPMDTGVLIGEVGSSEAVALVMAGIKAAFHEDEPANGAADEGNAAAGEA